MDDSKTFQSSNNNDKNKSEYIQQEYLSTLNEKELQAYHIAKSHLGMSFQLDKSVGFLSWKKQRENK